ncbi:MAG: hypothetical protein M3X11_24810 [Acidobacteriota bacterium]|nr:hypothetical protein [Acidobacteriota bacterium]
MNGEKWLALYCKQLPLKDKNGSGACCALCLSTIEAVEMRAKANRQKPALLYKSRANIRQEHAKLIVSRRKLAVASASSSLRPTMYRQQAMR